MIGDDVEIRSVMRVTAYIAFLIVVNAGGRSIIAGLLVVRIYLLGGGCCCHGSTLAHVWISRPDDFVALFYNSKTTCSMLVMNCTSWHHLRAVSLGKADRWK